MKQAKLLGTICGFTGVLIFGIVGCGPSDFVGGTVPVQGKVMVDGKPANHGSVTYWPDAAKGNTSKYEAVGVIGSDGTYTLSTRNKPGALPGAYKVTVMIQEKVDNTAPKGAKLEVPVEYTKQSTTKLEREVVATPAAGAYDLDVK